MKVPIALSILLLLTILPQTSTPVAAEVTEEECQAEILISSTSMDSVQFDGACLAEQFDGQISFVLLGAQESGMQIISESTSSIGTFPIDNGYQSYRVCGLHNNWIGFCSTNFSQGVIFDRSCQDETTESIVTMDRPNIIVTFSTVHGEYIFHDIKLDYAIDCRGMIYERVEDFFPKIIHSIRDFTPDEVIMNQLEDWSTELTFFVADDSGNYVEVSNLEFTTQDYQGSDETGIHVKGISSDFEFVAMNVDGQWMYFEVSSSYQGTMNDFHQFNNEESDDSNAIFPRAIYGYFSRNMTDGIESSTGGNGYFALPRKLSTSLSIVVDGAEQGDDKCSSLSYDHSTIDYEGSVNSPHLLRMGNNKRATLEMSYDFTFTSFECEYTIVKVVLIETKYHIQQIWGDGTLSDPFTIEGGTFQCKKKSNDTPSCASDGGETSGFIEQINFSVNPEGRVSSRIFTEHDSEIVHHAGPLALRIRTESMLGLCEVFQLTDDCSFSDSENLIQYRSTDQIVRVEVIP